MQEMSVNTSGGPVGARMRAFFVEDSPLSSGDAFEALRNAALGEIGVMPVGAMESLIPPDQVQSTAAYLGEYPPIVGFAQAKDAEE